jgi:putative acyl-CoA dehydrogenase
MRMALAQALHHVTHRVAFGQRLIDHALMRSVLADLALEYEAAVALTLRIARAFDAASDDTAGRSFARLAVAIAKYYLTKRTTNFVYECMECLGGQGYIEESPLPRLFREAPLNAIWEGSGNVIALDVLRTISRERSALESYTAELAHARGSNALLDAGVSELQRRLSHGTPPNEAEARWLAERMALLLQAALLVRHAPAAVSDAFCATRLAGQQGRTFGAFPSALTLDADAILERQHA